ncbi:hypothetical protein HY251_01000 [bacterium]|nr:hypothetical protein [bacterium]
MRAVPLRHRDIVSLAYAIEERKRLAVRPEAVKKRGLTPGPWLDGLKRAVSSGELSAKIDTGNGKSFRASDLARDLLVLRDGQRIVYVTDAADLRANRKKIIDLARGADVLVCEATFVREDQDRAHATGHLPAFAAAEIAREAKVGRLLPFHLSPRYEEAPERIFRELLEIFPRVQVPLEVAPRLGVRAEP